MPRWILLYKQQIIQQCLCPTLSPKRLAYMGLSLSVLGAECLFSDQTEPNYVLWQMYGHQPCIFTSSSNISGKGVVRQLYDAMSHEAASELDLGLFFFNYALYIPWCNIWFVYSCHLVIHMLFTKDKWQMPCSFHSFLSNFKIFRYMIGSSHLFKN